MHWFYLVIYIVCIYLQHLTLFKWHNNREEIFFNVTRKKISIDGDVVYFNVDDRMMMSYCMNVYFAYYILLIGKFIKYHRYLILCGGKM